MGAEDKVTEPETTISLCGFGKVDVAHMRPRPRITGDDLRQLGQWSPYPPIFTRLLNQPHVSAELRETLTTSTFTGRITASDPEAFERLIWGDHHGTDCPTIPRARQNMLP